MNVESKAQLNSLRMSPQKVRLVADVIRGMHVRDAEAQLLFSRKAAAKPLHTLLKSAVANAVHNHKMDPNSLVVSTIYVNEGVVLKRWMPRAQGRATPLRKRSSHITIVLNGEGAQSKTEVVTTENTGDVAPKTPSKTKKPARKTAAKPRTVSRAKAS